MVDFFCPVYGFWKSAGHGGICSGYFGRYNCGAWVSSCKKDKIYCLFHSFGIEGKYLSDCMMSDIHLGVFVGEKHIQNIVDKVNRLELIW